MHMHDIGAIAGVGVKLYIVLRRQRQKRQENSKDAKRYTIPAAPASRPIHLRNDLPVCSSKSLYSG